MVGLLDACQSIHCKVRIAVPPKIDDQNHILLKVLQLPGSEGLPFLTGCQEIPLAADLTSCTGFVQIMLNEIRNG